MAAADRFSIVVADKLHVFDPASNSVASVPFADVSGEQPATDSPLRTPAILTAHEIAVGERRTIVFWPSAHSKATPGQQEQAALAFSKLGELIVLEFDGPGVAKASSSAPESSRTNKPVVSCGPPFHVARIIPEHVLGA